MFFFCIFWIRPNPGSQCFLAGPLDGRVNKITISNEHPVKAYSCCCRGTVACRVAYICCYRGTVACRAAYICCYRGMVARRAVYICCFRETVANRAAYNWCFRGTVACRAAWERGSATWWTSWAEPGSTQPTQQTSGRCSSQMRLLLDEIYVWTDR